MSLWVDKYAPTSLLKLDYHLEQAKSLKRLSESANFPHLLFYGPPGSGKRTRIMCLLRELYGSGVDRMRMEHHDFLTPSNKKINISTISSNYHIEVNPSDVGIYDRIVIQELIKNMASTAQLDSGQQREFKVVVLHEADRLSRDAQHALRRTMEKYISTCRLILSAECTSKVRIEEDFIKNTLIREVKELTANLCTVQVAKGVTTNGDIKDLCHAIIAATRSRCLPIRIPAPSVDEIAEILKNTARREGQTMPLELAKRIALASERNLRRALLLAEVAKWQHSPMTPDQPIQRPDWQVFLAETASIILSEQSPRKILEVRGRLYELLSHCIPPNVIMRELVDNLLTSCDGNLKLEVVQLAADYEHRLNLGQKPIFHLEAFVIAFMTIYKRFVEDALGSGMDW